jgi:Kelch motif protein
MAGTWQPLANQPGFDASTMLLLTDGTVMCHDEGAAATGTANWWKLVPDAFGDYRNGTWFQLASGPNSPLFFASAVLKDGRVFVAGGEYNGTNATADLLAAEIYDPLTNLWTTLPTPPGWTQIGDASCCVLPDGRVFLGAIEDNRTAIYDPVSNVWTSAARKLNATSNEETWTLLPDGTILTVDCFGHPQTEKYLIASDTWINVGNTPTDLVEDASKEIGPALLLPDGRVFAIGSTTHTALYTMPVVPTDPGVWVDGPPFPAQQPGQTLGAKDAPACLLPNGRVLCVAGPVTGQANDYLAPTYFFEFDPYTHTLTAVAAPPNNGNAPFNGRMLLLPTGQVLYANGSTDIEIYTPDGAPNPSWQPVITTCPNTLMVGRTYTLQGQQLNGLSQAVSYGDDASMATNYPLVRFQSRGSGKIWYCRTEGHSSMGVATGTTLHATNFTVPQNADAGLADLVVVANGIPSSPLAVTIRPDPCQGLVDEIQNLVDEIDALTEALDNGEIPSPPRTPEKIAKVRAFIGRLRAQLRQRLQELKACRQANP